MKIKVTNIKKEFTDISTKINEIQLKNLENTVKNMILNLKDVTPVDTGNARDSWTYNRGLNKFFVVNTADYIQYLNEGTSKQAPKRFVENVALKYGKPFGLVVNIQD